MKQAVLLRRYSPSKVWDKAGLYYLNPPMPQVLRDGNHEYHHYVLVQVQGSTADMYASDAIGKLTGVYAKWLPLTRDDGEARGLFNVTPLTCAGALEAEGYTVVTMGEVTA